MNPLLLAVSLAAAADFPFLYTEEGIMDRVKKQASSLGASPHKPGGFASAALAMKPLLSRVEPLTVTVAFRIGSVDANEQYTPAARMVLASAMADAFTAARLPVQWVEVDAEGNGLVKFRAKPESSFDLGRITVDVFPGPSARGAARVPSRDLLEKILGRRFTIRLAGSLVPWTGTLSREFKLEGEVLVPASAVPAFLYRDKQARFNFWSIADTAVNGEGSPLQNILGSTELTVGPFKWDGTEASTEFMGLSLSGTRIAYQPEISIPLAETLGLKLKGKLKEKVVIKELAPPPLKTPEGGLLVTAEYSARGLKNLEPVGEEMRSVFYNGAGMSDGQRSVTTSPRHRSAIEASFGRSGGGRELYAGKSWFCEGLLAGPKAHGEAQEVWYDRVETAQGDMLFVRLNYVKVKVALSLSADQIPGDGEAPTLANLLFYLCPAPAS